MSRTYLSGGNPAKSSMLLKHAAYRTLNDRLTDAKPARNLHPLWLTVLNLLDQAFDAMEQAYCGNCP